MKLRLALISFAMLFGFLAIGQKVKYKDLFEDLEQRKFNKVEPQLRAFLSVEKNAAHPNANYQMGLITEANFTLQDIVEDTAQLFKLGEESISYLQNSLQYIDEKEIRKNEKYYQSFFRRDLRTGDFGIKLSDVHLDIEKKIESIENRMQAVRDFHSAVTDLTSLEGQMLEKFNSFVEGSSTYLDFLMAGDLDLISELGDLQALAKAFDERAKNTLEVEELLGVTDYYASIGYKDIEGFKELKPLMPESNTIINTWAFSAWATSTRKKLNDEVFELRNQILEIDRALAKDIVRIKGGAKTLTTTTLDRSLIGRLSKYDNQSLALDLLRAKLSRNIVTLLSDTAVNRNLLDSTMVVQQVKTSDSIVNHLQAIKNRLAFGDQGVQRANRYYEQYIVSAYGSLQGLQDYADQSISWAEEKLVEWDTVQSFWELRNNWGITNTDTIPLRTVEDNYEGDFVTNGFLEMPGDTIVSWGVKKDSLIGFIAKFGPDRKMIWETRFESEIFEERNLQLATDTIYSDSLSTVFYMFEPDSEKEIDLAVVNFSRDGEINWSAVSAAGRKPEYAAYAPVVRETTIFLYPQESYPLPGEELGYIVIDGNGQIK